MGRRPKDAGGEAVPQSEPASRSDPCARSRGLRQAAR